MTMEPALTAEEWAAMEYDERVRVYEGVEGLPDSTVLQVTDDLNVFHRDHLPALIALANAALPDSDPRKITRDWLCELKIAQNEAQEAAWRSCMNGSPGKPCDECQRAVDGFKARLQRIADVLASYLPPEGA